MTNSMGGTSDPANAPTLRPAFAILLAIVVACWAAFTAAPGPTPAPVSTDIDQLWYGARALLAGANPWESIGPNAAVVNTYPLVYPLPAVLVGIPFAGLPIEVLRSTVAGLSTGLLVYCIARTDARGLVILASRSFYLSVTLVSWTPLLMLMWWWPYASVAVAIKPTTGVAMLTGVKEWRKAVPGLVVAGAVTALCFLIRPSWVGDWLAATENAPTTRPWILTPWAFLALAVLAFPRRWESRFLAVFLLVPQTPHTLAALPLVMLPATLWGKALVAALTWLPGFIIIREPFGSRLTGLDSMHAMLAHILLWSVILPTVLLVLWDGYREQRKAESQELPAFAKPS